VHLTMNPLKIHFLNVGHGDCTIMEFPSGRIAMMDINDSGTLDQDTEDELGTKLDKLGPSIYKALGLGIPHSLKSKLEEYRKTKVEDPVAYFLSLKKKSIFRYIQSHPDMDHMSGLARLLSSGVTITNFWDTAHDVQKDSEWTKGKYDEKDWDAYQQIRASSASRQYLAGSKLQYFNEDGISIVHPTVSKPDATDPNEVSYVLLLNYGECNILLGGDAPAQIWETLHKAITERGNGYKRIHLFKSPHHGRKSGYYWPFVKGLNPDMTVVSVGDLSSQHDAADSYEKYSKVGCYTTREHGTLIAYCWPNGQALLYDKNGNIVAHNTGALAVSK
jgi:competence protein ComEC